MVPSAFIALDKLPLSGNGKVDRRALPEPEHAQPDESFEGARNEKEQLLADVWGRVLGVERVGIHDNFFNLGGDSILAIRIASKSSEAGLRLTADKFFQYPTIAELVEVAGKQQEVEAEQGAVTGRGPLTPIQHWFFEQEHADLNHWNQAVMLEVDDDLDSDSLMKAVAAIVEHHDALRMRVRRDASAGWVQEFAALEQSEVVEEVDLSGAEQEMQRAAIEEQAERWQRRVNIEVGPVMRVGVMRLGEGRGGRVMVVIHHMAVDGVSWRVMLADMEKGYEQAMRGEQIRLGAKTTSYKRWGEKLEEYAKSEELKGEARYWEEEASKDVRSIPVDYEGGRERNEVRSARSVRRELSKEETREVLQEVGKAYKTEIGEVMMCAMAEAIGEWTGERRVRVEMEGHGREEIGEGIDVSRTVGWFTSIFPVVFDIREANDLGESLKRIKEQMRRIPRRGVGYGALKYLSRDEQIKRRMQSFPQAEISFNYLGQLDEILLNSSLYSPAQESCGSMYSPDEKRRYLINIFGSVIGRQLNLIWEYSSELHSQSTIEQLADATVESLRSIIAHCTSSVAGGYTPSDFPLAELDQDELDQAFGKVEFED